MNTTELEAIYGAVSNWGRWGSSDERGTLNYVTPMKRVAALRTVTSGATVSLAHPLPTQASAECPRPLVHVMLKSPFAYEKVPTGASDFFAFASHGMWFTHLDALCHMFWRGQVYNGFSQEEIRHNGAFRCSIDQVAGGILTRGILLDIPAQRGVDWLDLGERIYPADLDAAEKAHGVEVGEGDALLIRTGRGARRQAKGPWDPRVEGLAGLDPSCLHWLFERRIALLGSDGVHEVHAPGDRENEPTEVSAEAPAPVHTGCLTFMGVHLLDNANLDLLSKSCAEHKRYDFVFTLGPLVVEHATASPVNPIALF